MTAYLISHGDMSMLLRVLSPLISIPSDPSARNLGGSNLAVTAELASHYYNEIEQKIKDDGLDAMPVMWRDPEKVAIAIADPRHLLDVIWAAEKVDGEVVQWIMIRCHSESCRSIVSEQILKLGKLKGQGEKFVREFFEQADALFPKARVYSLPE